MRTRKCEGVRSVLV